MAKDKNQKTIEIMSNDVLRGNPKLDIDRVITEGTMPDERFREVNENSGK